MPLNLSFTHVMVVFIVALVVLGPDKLPEAARAAARWIHAFRRMASELQTEVRESFPEFTEPLSELRDAVAGVTSPPVAAPSPEAETQPAEPLAELPSLGSSPPVPGTFTPRPDGGPA